VAGLGGWWKLDEAGGDLALDSSGAANDGTLENGPIWTAGKLGAALLFDGDDDFVQLPDVVPAGAFTVTFWMKPSLGNWSGTLLDATRAPIYFFVDGTQSELRWFFESANDADVQVTAPFAFEAETWYHVAATGRFGSSGPHRLYIDAVQRASSSTTVNGKGALNPMRIGNSADTYGSKDTGFPGTIDDLRVYTRVLSAYEIAELAQIGGNESPVADDDTAGTVSDTPVAIDVLANDIDPDGDPLAVVSVTQGAHGTVLNNGSDVTYAPDAGFVGTDLFSYVVSDGQGGEATATVSVVVASSNPDLYGHWRFDEGSGVVALDSSGAGRDGALKNGPQWTAGKLGTALQFDGGDDYVQLPDVVPAGEFTITFWMKPSASTWSGVLLDATRNPIYFFVDGTQSDLRWYFESANDADVQITAPFSFAAGTWYHVAATGRFGSSGPHRLYINAVQRASSSTAVNGKGALNPMRIGNSADTYGSKDTGFPGTIDDLRVYSRVLTASEIEDLAESGSGNAAPVAADDAAETQTGSAVAIDVLANDVDPDGDPLTVAAVTQGANGAVSNDGSGVTYAPNAGFVGTDQFTYTVSDGQGGEATATVSVNVTDPELFGYWKLDEGNGVVAGDASGSRLDGTLFNDPLWTAGRSGTALLFDGDDDYVQLPDVVPTGPFTITFWMKPSSATWSGTLLDATRDPIYFFVDGTQSQLRWFFESANDADVQVTVPFSFEADTWYHVAATGRFGSSGPHRLYIDAVQRGESARAVNGKGTLNPMRIGNSADTYGSRDTGFPGTIDDLRVYTRVLTPTEIAGLAGQ
jgi:hypothetical protein